MKKLFFTFVLSFVMLLIVSPAMAQQTAPGDPGGEPTGEPPMGGGAPIGGGTFILMALGAAYGSKKLYALNKEEKNK